MKKTKIEFIEYINSGYEEYAATVLDSDRNVICWIISSFNEKKGKLIYTAINHQGKALFPATENLLDLKKQLRRFNRERKEQELKELRNKKSRHKEQELSR